MAALLVVVLGAVVSRLRRHDVRVEGGAALCCSLLTPHALKRARVDEACRRYSLAESPRGSEQPVPALNATLTRASARVCARACTPFHTLCARARVPVRALVPIK